MAEIIQQGGTWTFDGDLLRLVPGRDRNVGLLRRTLGELTVPLRALTGISFEPGRRSGRLRLRLRDGADPLLQVAGGRLTDALDPYQLPVEPRRYGVAEYFVDEVRDALLLEQVPADGVDAYLLRGPAVPLSAAAGDGSAAFDGETIRLDWNWKTEEAKAAAGSRSLPLAEVTSVEWQHAAGLENGHLRFTVRDSPTKAPPKYDPNAIELWGFKKDPLMVLVAAAVQARLPHPSAAGAPRDGGTAGPPRLLGKAGSAPADGVPADPAAPPAGEDHDALLRRLRELGELHRTGVLTDEEFSTAKQAVLKRM